MMPTRYIRESCRTSKNLQRVSDFSERLFWRMLTMADDYGRCVGSPEVVRAECFPFDLKLSLKKVNEALHDLQTHTLIILYSVSDREYVQFCTFEAHQGKARALKSKHPEPIQGVESLSANRCLQVHANALGGPNTNTDINSLLPDLKSNGHAKKRVLRCICDDDRPTPKNLEFAKSLHIDPGPEWGKFKNYCLAHDKRYANFEAAFRNWLANSQTMRRA